MVIPTSDSESVEFPYSIPDGAPGDDPTGAVERTDPRAVLADWFDDSAASLDDLFAELVAAYEIDQDEDDEPRGDELAEITVETVRRYLYNRKAKPGRTDPRQAMTEWFSVADAYQELPQPFTMLTVTFQYSWGLTSTQLAHDAVDTIQRYLRDSADELDRGQP
jgi:hypothetical protein